MRQMNGPTVVANSSSQCGRGGALSRTVIGVIFFAAMLASLSASYAAWGLEQAARAEEHALTIREQIVGTWRLDSIYEEDAGGEEINQFGVAPSGLFMADSHGNFSFQIMSVSTAGVTQPEVYRRLEWAPPALSKPWTISAPMP